MPETTQELKHSFRATIKMLVETSDEEFKTIQTCMIGHYDYSVKSSVEVGGFMYGWANRRKWALQYGDKVPDLICDFESRQMQLTLKALEIWHTEEVNALAKRLWNIVHEANKVSEEVNSKFINIYKQ